MITFIIILLLSNDALARDPNRFAHLLTERLNAFVEAEAVKRGIADDQTLAFIQQSHNAFKGKMPNILKQYDHIPLPNQSMIIKVAQATMINLQHKLIETYHASSSALQKRSDTDALFNKLLNSGPRHLDKISQFNFEPSLYSTQKLKKLLLEERKAAISALGKYDGFQDLDIPKEFNSMYFTDLPGAWNFLKKVEKDLVLDLLLIEHNLRMTCSLKPWLEDVIRYVRKSKNLQVDEKKESILNLEGRYIAIHADSLLSMNEILGKIRSSEQGAPDDLMRELLEHNSNNPTIQDQDYGKKVAATIFQTIHKDIKLSWIMGFLTKTSSIFLFAFGFSMLIFYYSDKKGEVEVESESE
jgi:hypothetical protein